MQKSVMRFMLQTTACIQLLVHISQCGDKSIKLCHNFLFGRLLWGSQHTKVCVEFNLKYGRSLLQLHVFTHLL